METKRASTTESDIAVNEHSNSDEETVWTTSRPDYHLCQRKCFLNAFNEFVDDRDTQFAVS